MLSFVYMIFSLLLLAMITNWKGDQESHQRAIGRFIADSMLYYQSLGVMNCMGTNQMNQQYGLVDVCGNPNFVGHSLGTQYLCYKGILDYSRVMDKPCDSSYQSTWQVMGGSSSNQLCQAVQPINNAIKASVDTKYNTTLNTFQTSNDPGRIAEAYHTIQENLTTIQQLPAFGNNNYGLVQSAFYNSFHQSFGNVQTQNNNLSYDQLTAYYGHNMALADSFTDNINQNDYGDNGYYSGASNAPPANMTGDYYATTTQGSTPGSETNRPKMCPRGIIQMDSRPGSEPSMAYGTRFFTFTDGTSFVATVVKNGGMTQDLTNISGWISDGLSYLTHRGSSVGRFDIDDRRFHMGDVQTGASSLGYRLDQIQIDPQDYGIPTYRNMPALINLK